MEKVKEYIFRNYDIRGIFGEDLTKESVVLIGKAIGTYIKRRGGEEVVVGRDGRLSSPQIRDWLVEGMVSTGLEIIDVGMVPTPLTYFAIFHWDKDGGVMITGSHNPPQYNGFKVLCGKETLFGEEIKSLYRLIQKEDFESGQGKVRERDVVQPYINFLLANIHPTRKMKLVVDGGNGVGCFVARELFERMGHEVHPLYCEVDGRFPHHHPDPTVPENMEDLSRKTVALKADLGIGYDGDADRLGVVDDRGRLLFGDQIMMILIREVLEKNPGAKIISDVKASKFLFEEIKKLGGIPIMWKTGHSFIKKKMREEGALLAGEMSGHIFYNDRYYGFDDAIYASARLVEYLSGLDTPLSELVDSLPKAFSTPEIRVETTEDKKFEVVEKVKEKLRTLHPDYPVVDIDGVRIEYPDGWALVRASNTQPVLVMRFEASSPEALERIRKEVEEIVREFL